MPCGFPQARFHSGGAAFLLGRIVDWDGTPIQRDDIASASYTIHQIDERSETPLSVVEGHDDITIASEELDDAIQNELVLDKRWTADREGYNFVFQIPANVNDPFPVPGALYRVSVTLVPTAGQNILAHWYGRAV